MKRWKLVSLLIFSLLPHNHSWGQVASSDVDLAKKVDEIFLPMNSGKSPGAAIVVVRDGKVLYCQGYGLANLEHDEPITPSTVFDIASVSKQFAGMAIAMLIERGKLSLDDDVRKYIPELPDFGKTITIYHLLHHTSGLRDWPGTLALAGWSMEDVISFDQILNMAYHQQALNFDPGDKYVYSNTGYNLLAEVVQRVAGQSFRTWIDENIFQPLGMGDSHFQDDHTELVPNMAYGYAADGKGGYKTIKNSLTALGSSSLYTTVEDLAKWVINLDDMKVGGENVIRAMAERGRLNGGEKIAYGYGLSNGEYKGLKTLDHSGGWASFQTFLLHFPEQHFSVVVLANHSPSNPYRAAYKIADIYLAADLEDGEEKTENPRTPASGISDAVLEEYLGTYKLGPGWYVTINKGGVGLTAYATNEQVVPMIATSETSFWVPAYNAPIEFGKDNSGNVTHFEYRGMTCPKVMNFKQLTAEELKAYEGEYFSRELNTSYVIQVEEGKLVAKHLRHGTLSLTQAWSNDFVGPWFMGSVEFTTDPKGDVNGFSVTQNRSRNQKFERKKPDFK